MNATLLREIQEPLKAKYKANPELAFITLKATSKTGEGITCKVETGKNLIQAGLHPATGGNGMDVCSGEMLLEALAACAGVTLRAVSTAIEFNLEDATVNVEGDLDFRGTLSVDKNVPVGFKEIRLRFDLQTAEDPEKVAKLIKLTERYCVVFQTLIQGNAIQVSVVN
jgi:uncharacterized OsmC-like protein